MLRLLSSLPPSSSTMAMRASRGHLRPLSPCGLLFRPHEISSRGGTLTTTTTPTPSKDSKTTSSSKKEGGESEVITTSPSILDPKVRMALIEKHSQKYPGYPAYFQKRTDPAAPTANPTEKLDEAIFRNALTHLEFQTGIMYEAPAKRRRPQAQHVKLALDTKRLERLFTLSPAEAATVYTIFGPRYDPIRHTLALSMRFRNLDVFRESRTKPGIALEFLLKLVYDAVLFAKKRGEPGEYDKLEYVDDGERLSDDTTNTTTT